MDPTMDETDVRDRLLELKVIQERLRAFHSERGPSHQKRLDNPVLLPRTYAGAEPIRYAHHLTSEHSAMLRHVAPGDLIDTSGPFGKACDAFYELSRQVSETLEAGRDREALQALQEALEQCKNFFGSTAVQIALEEFAMRPHEYIELYGGRPGLHCLPLLNPNIGVRAGRKLRLEMWAGTLEFFEDEDAEAQIAKQKEAAARAAAAEAVAAAAVARGRRTLRKALSQTFSKKSSRGLAE